MCITCTADESWRWWFSSKDSKTVLCWDPQESGNQWWQWDWSAEPLKDPQEFSGYSELLLLKPHPGHTLTCAGDGEEDQQTRKETESPPRHAGIHQQTPLSGLPLSTSPCLLQTYTLLPSFERTMDAWGKLRVLKNTKYFHNLLPLTEEESAPVSSLLWASPSAKQSHSITFSPLYQPEQVIMSGSFQVNIFFRCRVS